MGAGYSKTITCLASSVKHSGKCIAGKDATGWIRPVSSRPKEEISNEERMYSDGTFPDVGDVLKIEFKKHTPSGYQSENHLIDTEYFWELKGRRSFSELEDMVESPSGPLWQNGPSTYNGVNDQVPIKLANRFSSSLILIKPENLVVRRQFEGYGYRTEKRRASFDLNGEHYSLMCTDPWAESGPIFLGQKVVSLNDVLICVSLGEDFHGNAYKLVASIITRDRIGR